MTRLLRWLAVDGDEHERIRSKAARSLARCPIVVLIQSVRPSIALTDPDRDAVIDAMRIAAEKRTEGILGSSRRQHYGHAALLVASCVALAPKSRATAVASHREIRRLSGRIRGRRRFEKTAVGSIEGVGSGKC